MVRRHPPARPAGLRAPLVAVLSLVVLGTAGAAITVAAGPDHHAEVEAVAGGPNPAGNDEPAPDPDPTPEPAPAPDGPDDPDDPAEPDDPDDLDDGVDIPWLSIALVLVALVALFVLARVLLRPRSAPAPSRAGSPDDVFRALGDAQWVHDQASLDVLAGPAETASARWAAQRPVVDGIVRDALRRGSADPRSGWNELAAFVAAVQRALDTATAARSDTSTDPAVVAESVAVVERARAQLLAQIDQVRRQV